MCAGFVLANAQLPAPDFRVGNDAPPSCFFAHLDLEDMDRNDRIRACYQHCCLRYVMNEQMTNQSLRERFKLAEKKIAAVSNHRGNRGGRENQAGRPDPIFYPLQELRPVLG